MKDARRDYTLLLGIYLRRVKRGYDNCGINIFRRSIMIYSSRTAAEPRLISPALKRRDVSLADEEIAAA
jgi:hypothetical protein